ncbi:MAG: hypothetical protein LBR60_04320, partial [Fibrobacter sp.]|nr:hypothetical protein [Fibrobacter sp.]
SLQVDVALGETITYTMTAASTGAKITGYTWTKAAGTSNTATFTPAEKGDVTGVSVKVANDDNTVQSFDCPSVKAIDSSSPDYELTAPDTKITIPAGNVIIAMNLPANWHNGTEGTCTFACNADGVFSGTVNGNATISGEWYATTKIPITSTINGYALSVTLDKPATCQIGW